MKRISVFFYVIILAIAVSSCEGCVKRSAKKATHIGLDVVEGVAEAVNERGDTLGQKLMDATGTVAQGAGRSLDRQLNEHAEHVAAVAGRTLVQTVEGLDSGIIAENYDELVSKEELCSGVALEYFGKIKSSPVTDAYFIVTKDGTYTAKFEFCNDNCKTSVLTKVSEFSKSVGDKKYTVVSFAFNHEELALLATAKCIKVIVASK